MNPLKSQLLFKTVCSENKTFLVFSAGKKDAINYSEVQTLEEKSYREYFLPLQCVSRGRKTRIKYDISGYTSISEYLRTDIAQKQYFDVIAGIQKILSFCQRSHFSLDNLMCDPKYIYCHNITKQIMMIYMPMDNKSFVHDDIPKCLKKMHKAAKIKVSDYHYKNEYEKFLDGFHSDKKNMDQNQFNPAMLLHFLNSNQMVCFENDEQDGQQNVQETTDNNSFPINAQLAKAEIEAVEAEEAEDTEETYSGTVVRHRGNDTYFTDSSGNRIDIESFPYSIGRNKKNDLVIEEPTVSGEHAVITEKDGKYFISDSSSNGTFLNDEDNRITTGEIHNGDKLYFDSFCYTFHSAQEESEDEECTRTVVVSRNKGSEAAAEEKAAPEPEAEPDLDLEPEEASEQHEENCTVVDVRALAYLQKVSDNTIVNITSFPYTSTSDEGVMITCDTIGTRKRMFIENKASNELYFEGMVIPEGRKAEMFSGCSLTISGEKYYFRVNK